MAAKEVNHGSVVLDIGCYDGILFEKLGKKLKYGIGIDPLIENKKCSNYQLVNGLFPQSLPSGYTKFDAITLIAVIEHIQPADIDILLKNLNQYLTEKGKVIISVPEPIVDKILSILIKLKILDGMSVEQHYGFDTQLLVPYFEKHGFRLHKHRKFQLGVNNIFVFTKI
jgi:2-polyprenyl-3-methyl-5-hydroxy-6-metoxy-1,4-benzoquinol methylase